MKLSMSMFATKADYDKAVAAQSESERPAECTLAEARRSIDESMRHKDKQGSTPRTDVVFWTMCDQPGTATVAYGVMVQHAITLERELAKEREDFDIMKRDRDYQRTKRLEAEAAQSATGALPAWVSDWTPEMMQAVENYYMKWQRLEGIHQPDRAKADAWSALHAWRAALNAALDEQRAREGK